MREIESNDGPILESLSFATGPPILWFSNGQNTGEISSFGSEFVAAHIVVELIEGL